MSRRLPVAAIALAPLLLGACGSGGPVQMLKQAGSLASTAHLATESWLQHAAPTHFAVHTLRGTSGQAHQQAQKLRKQSGSDTAIINAFTIVGNQATALAERVRAHDGAGAGALLQQLDSTQNRIGTLLKAYHAQP